MSNFTHILYINITIYIYIKSIIIFIYRSYINIKEFIIIVFSFVLHSFLSSPLLITTSKKLKLFLQVTVKRNRLNKDIGDFS